MAYKQLLPWTLPTLSQLRSLLLYERKLLTPKMSTFDASTPQLKTVKNLMDAFASFNLDKFAALLSKNFQYEAFGGVTDLAKMDTEAYAEVIQGLYVGVTKTDVGIQQRGTVFDPTG